MESQQESSTKNIAVTATEGDLWELGGTSYPANGRPWLLNRLGFTPSRKVSGPLCSILHKLVIITDAHEGEHRHCLQ